jgi:hypothetical protein
MGCEPPNALDLAIFNFSPGQGAFDNVAMGAKILETRKHRFWQLLV